MYSIKYIPKQDIAAGGILGAGIGTVVATAAIKRGNGPLAAIGFAVTIAVTSATAIHRIRRARSLPPTKVEAMVRTVNRFRSR